MILWIYKHLREDDKIFGYCDAFEAQLGRHRKPKTQAVEAALAFVQIFRMLLQEKVEKQDLIDRIQKTPNLYYRAELLEQAASYKGRYATRKRRK